MFWPAPSCAPRSQFFGHGFSARIIEPHAIDQRVIGDGAKKPRGGVARLRMPGYSTKFAKAEAEGGPGGNCFSEFIHPCRDANRVRELQTEKFYRQQRSAEEFLEQIAKHFVAARPPQGAESA